MHTLAQVTTNLNGIFYNNIITVYTKACSNLDINIEWEINEVGDTKQDEWNGEAGNELVLRILWLALFDLQTRAPGMRADTTIGRMEWGLTE